MVRSVNAPGGGEDLRIQAEVRRELGMDPLLTGSVDEGVRVITASRLDKVMSGIENSADHSVGGDRVRPHRPNRNQFLSPGTLSIREEAIICMSPDDTRFRT